MYQIHSLIIVGKLNNLIAQLFPGINILNKEIWKPVCSDNDSRQKKTYS